MVSKSNLSFLGPILGVGRVLPKEKPKNREKITEERQDSDNEPPGVYVSSVRLADMDFFGGRKKLKFLCL